MLVIEQLAHATVTATVSKLLQRDLFGVEKLMPWGVRVYSTLIGDYQEKSQAIITIGEFAQAMGVRRKYREQVEQCMDEMLMNALYDAPVDDEGKPLFADVPVKERVLMRVDQKAIVQYACDGERFAVSVRDAFGTLEKRRSRTISTSACMRPRARRSIARRAAPGSGSTSSPTRRPRCTSIFSPARRRRWCAPSISRRRGRSCAPLASSRSRSRARPSPSTA